MHKALSLVFTLLCATILTAQSEQFFFQKLDCRSASTLCFDPDSNLWIGATRGGQPLFLKVSRNGILLDQLQLDMPFGSGNIPTGLFVDSEGMLVGCGTMSPAIPSQYESSFVFRYDPVARELLWSRRMYNAFLFLKGIMEKSPGGPYFVFGVDNGIPELAQLLLLDRNTGETLPDFNFAYRYGPQENLSAAVCYKGDYYTVGMQDLRSFNGFDPGPFLQQGLSRFDSNGTPVWTVNGSVPVNQRSRLRGRDLIVEDDAIYSLSNGDEVYQLPFSTRSKIYLQKTNLDGTPLWIRKYEVQEFDYLYVNGGQLISVADGFVVLGSGLNNDFLLKTDKTGNLLWAQRIKTNGSFANTLVQAQDNLLTDGQALYFVSNMQEGSTSFGVLIKTDLNGNIAGCDRVEPLLAAELPLPNPVFTQTQLSAYPTTILSENTATSVPAVTAFATEKLCKYEGPALQNPCKPTTFLRRPDATNANLQFTTMAVLPQGVLCLAAQDGPAVRLSCLDAGGNALWSRTLEPAPGDSLVIDGLAADSDSLLAGCGYLVDAQGQRSRYAFRLRPDSTAALLWSVLLPGQNAGGGGIFETKPGGNFLLYHNLSLPDGRQSPETIRLERQTGAVVPLSGRQYDFEKGDQYFSSLLANNFGIYALGEYRLPNGRPRMALTRLNDFGGLFWAYTSHSDTATQAVSGGYGSVCPGGDNNVISAYTGKDAGQPGALFLQKTTPLGSIVWLRRIDLPDVAEISLMAVPGAYVLLVKTGPGAYLLLKTDLHGNLLAAKKFAFGAGLPGGNGAALPAPNRVAYLAEHLFFILYDDQAGASYLLKTDLNLEIAKPCAYFANIAPGTGAVFNPVATIFTEGVFVAQYNSESFQVAGHARELPLEQQCPPVYVEPTLDLGPDRSICSLDKALLTPSDLSFVSYLWQDGSTAPALEATASGTYILEATTMCGTVLRDTVQVNVSDHPSRADTLAGASGFPVQLGGNVYYFPDTVTLRIPSGTGLCDTLHTYFLGPCKPVSTEKSLTFYPGQTLTLDGKAYDQPGTYTHTLQTLFGCDSLVTYTLEWLITSLDVICPTDRTDTAALSLTSHPVFYNPPVVSTDCPEPGTGYSLLTGLPSGAPFPVGNTLVCYELKNGCGIRDTCCFRVTVVPTIPPCDIKTPGNCLQVELLGIQLDSVGNRRYNIRLRNTCSEPLDYVAFQVPKGVQAVQPANDAVYTAGSGNTYLVRHPNFSPFYSIRFRALSGQLKNGASDVFEYALPQQAAPAYIRVYAKFIGGNAVETHLSALNCDPLPWAQNRSTKADFPEKNPALRLWPNPAGSLLNVDLSNWSSQRVQLCISNAQGQLVFSEARTVSENVFLLNLPESMASGVYNLSVRGPDGQRRTARFALIRE